MVSHPARAEALIGQCKVVSWMPERIVLIIRGPVHHWGVMAPVLWVLAVLSTITVIHRIVHLSDTSTSRRWLTVEGFQFSLVSLAN
jgi:CDP-diacylglycerol--glycerol-3-phosphate 3-phosphatidyltransferase